LKKSIAIVCACLLSFAAGTAVYSSNVGTDSDPLVSKSYVDNQISILKSQMSQTTTQTSQTTQTTQPSQSTSQTSTDTTSYEGFETVAVPVGGTLYGGDGTEIILRAGKGTVFITGADGIADLTNGQNLKSGATVSMNHLMVVPRGDGRGIVVSEAAWFLVKGKYTLTTS
jgi:hypothetical protein